MTNSNIKVGGTLTIKNEIISIGGQILFKKGQKVKIREVLTHPGYWSKLCPDIYVPEKITGVRIRDQYGDWNLGCFKEFTVNPPPLTIKGF